jgi:hypothetical protein
MPEPSGTWRARYLDVSGVEVAGDERAGRLHHLLFLHHLNVSRCSLSALRLHTPHNLKVLDVSHNTLASLASLHNLRVLDVSHNALASLASLHNLRVLDVSHNALASLASLQLSRSSPLERLDVTGNPFLLSAQSHGLGAFLCNQGARLKVLHISHTGLALLPSRTFCCRGDCVPGDPLSSGLETLRRLDLRQSGELQLERGGFAGLDQLETLVSSDPLACCMFTDLFPLSKRDCLAPADELSSCDDLLRSDFLRAFPWLLSLAELLGN